MPNWAKSLTIRVAMSMIGDDKTGNLGWYQEFVPKADAIYAQHMREIGEE
jgi:hypothetical protein